MMGMPSSDQLIVTCIPFREETALKSPKRRTGSKCLCLQSPRLIFPLLPSSLSSHVSDGVVHLKHTVLPVPASVQMTRGMPGNCIISVLHPESSVGVQVYPLSSRLQNFIMTMRRNDCLFLLSYRSEAAAKHMLHSETEGESFNLITGFTGIPEVEVLPS